MAKTLRDYLYSKELFEKRFVDYEGIVYMFEPSQLHGMWCYLDEPDVPIIDRILKGVARHIPKKFRPEHKFDYGRAIVSLGCFARGNRIAEHLNDRADPTQEEEQRSEEILYRRLEEPLQLDAVA